MNEKFSFKSNLDQINDNFNRWKFNFIFIRFLHKEIKNSFSAVVNNLNMLKFFLIDLLKLFFVFTNNLEIIVLGIQ